MSADRDSLEAAIERAAGRRLDAFLRGVEAYRSHPYRRDLADPPALWSRGATRLLDYGQTGDAAGRKGRLPAAVIVPSLINRATVLDLRSERSLLRWLAGADGTAACRPLLLDWGHPDDDALAASLENVVAGRIEPALEHVAAETGRAPVIVGYCMGGLLALAAAVRRPELVGGLALIATPWDFHAENGAHAALLARLWPLAEPLFSAAGAVPVDVLQCLFFALDPLLALRKFADFARLDPASPQARAFVALEDWINDGVPLSTRIATECFLDWYGANRPANGTWHVGGVAIRPQTVTAPAFVACPRHDRIVPPASSQALAAQIPDALVLQPPVGHIGMIVGGRARETFWQPFAGWLRKLR